MNDSDKNSEDFKSEYRTDKKRNGLVSICFGVLLIAWTAFDIASNFWDEYWYMNIFFILFGLVYIVSGIEDVRKYPSQKHNDREN